MGISIRWRVAACLTVSTVALSATAYAQQATEPAPAELPPLEVTTKASASKKATAKKKVQAKAAAPQPAASAPEAEPQGAQRSGAVTNAASPVTDYVATDSTVGTKTDTPLKETPQSISVVGQEQMRDQGVQNLQETLRYVPGVISDPWGYDSRYDGSTIRGIAAANYVDGLRTTYGYGSSTVMIEPYALERVEVLRGPSSMLYGQTPTGGIINAVSKMPSEIPYRESASNTARSISSRSSST